MSEPTPATTPRNPGFDGMDARNAGSPLDACPYPEPGPQRTAWVVGWFLVEREKERANAQPAELRRLAGGNVGPLAGAAMEKAASEIVQLRALVTRLTDVAQDLVGGLTDPGAEAMAAIHCGRHFIYG